MPQNQNDAMWDPRPRLEPVPEGESPEVPADTGAVLVELAAGPGILPVAALDVARRLELPGFALDEEFGATPLGEATSSRRMSLRGHAADEAVVTALEDDPRVVKVWRDARRALLTRRGATSPNR